MSLLVILCEPLVSQVDRSVFSSGWETHSLKCEGARKAVVFISSQVARDTQRRYIDTDSAKIILETGSCSTQVPLYFSEILTDCTLCHLESTKHDVEEKGTTNLQK